MPDFPSPKLINLNTLPNALDAENARKRAENDQGFPAPPKPYSNPLLALRNATSISSGAPKINQTTLAGMPMPGLGEIAPGAASGLRGAIYGLSPQTQEVMEGMYQKANPIFKALQEAGEFGGDRSTGTLTPLPSPSLGTTNPEFTPSGGESLYNLGKQGLQSLIDPVERAYTSILGKGGR